MADLQNPRWMYLKAVLFLLIIAASAFLILLEHPDWRIAILLALLIWSSARLYYFMFYVIEKYADPEYKFAGVWDFVRYLWRRKGE